MKQITDIKHGLVLSDRILRRYGRYTRMFSLDGLMYIEVGRESSC
jgi:hypothetical protein